MSDEKITTEDIRAMLAEVRAALDEQKAVSDQRDWVVAPGDILREWRDENGISAETVSICALMDIALYTGIEAGRIPIDERLALALAIATGITVDMWLELERIYREGLAAGKTHQSPYA